MWCQYTANIYSRNVADGVFKIELANSLVSPEVHWSGAILYGKAENVILDYDKRNWINSSNVIIYFLAIWGPHLESYFTWENWGVVDHVLSVAIWVLFVF